MNRQTDQPEPDGDGRSHERAEPGAMPGATTTHHDDGDGRESDDLDALPPSPFGGFGPYLDDLVGDLAMRALRFDEVPQPGAIFGAMARVSARIEPIEKRQVDAGPGGKFKAKTIDDVFFAVRAALAAEGVFVVQRVVGHSQDTRSTSGNKVVFRDDYDVEVWFVADDGSRIMTGPWPGRGEDLMDKSPTKGLSYAIKAALIGTFLIVGGVPEPDENAPGESTRPEDRPPWSVGWESLDAYHAEREALAERIRKLPEQWRLKARQVVDEILETSGASWRELPLPVYRQIEQAVTRMETDARAADAEQSEPAAE